MGRMLLLGFLVALACAPTTAEWTRARVDPISVQDESQLEKDITDCALLADRAYHLAVKEADARALRQMLAGAALGAAMGAAIGEAVADDAGTGAAVGGAAGAYDSAWVASNEEAVRQAAIGNCLRHRGYKILW